MKPAHPTRRPRLATLALALATSCLGAAALAPSPLMDLNCTPTAV